MKHLKIIWHKWKKVARKIGDFQARVLLTICYVLVVAPLGGVMRLFKKTDKTKADSFSYWLIKSKYENTLNSGKRQF